MKQVLSAKEKKVPGFVAEAKLAFFDLDETITDTDTDGLWARWRLVKSSGGLREVIAIFSLMRAYRRGTMSIERYMEYQKRRVSSLTVDTYEEMTDRFFEQWGRKHIFSEAEEIIASYKSSGVPTVLLTAQSEVIGRRFAGYLKMDRSAGNGFSIEGNRYTSPKIPYCYREGKIHYAEQFAAEFKYDLSECAFYSDSINDLPLLESVGFPVVTNPDSLLEEEARKRGWDVFKFKKRK